MLVYIFAPIMNLNKVQHIISPIRDLNMANLLPFGNQKKAWDCCIDN